MKKDSISCQMLVIGGSAGSLDVLMQVLPLLNAPAFPVLIVLHRKYSIVSSLTELLALRTNMPVREVSDKEPIVNGHIYLAPSDYHVLIESKSEFALDSSEKVNYSRPSIDVTFESAADVYGPALTALLLSGANADGVEGLKAIKTAGGRTLVQQPASAQFPFMPEQAILHAPVDHILDIPEMTRYINNL